MLFSFTHTSEIDWMLPGIAPTGRKVEIPLVAIVRFRGDKVAHEHIYWDQASVLVQIGLLDPKGLPVAGIETARKVAGQDAAEQRADDPLAHQRRQADLIRLDAHGGRRCSGCGGPTVLAKGVSATPKKVRAACSRWNSVNLLFVRSSVQFSRRRSVS